jgi:hypothetical protein
LLQDRKDVDAVQASLRSPRAKLGCERGQMEVSNLTGIRSPES